MKQRKRTHIVTTESSALLLVHPRGNMEDDLDIVPEFVVGGRLGVVANRSHLTAIGAPVLIDLHFLGDIVHELVEA